jgi:hypothetical protein
VVVAAAHAVDHRNTMAHGHSSRVTSIAEAVDMRAGLAPSKLEELRMAAFLHDVGHMTLGADAQNLEMPTNWSTVIMASPLFGMTQAIRFRPAA